MEMKTAKGSKMKKVFICSPFSSKGATREECTKERRRNLDEVRHSCRLAVELGYIPYAPHLYFPQFLTESDHDEREMGILLGLTWLARCDEIWIIGDRISAGMKREINMAEEWGIAKRYLLTREATEERILAAIFGIGDPCEEQNF